MEVKYKITECGSPELASGVPALFFAFTVRVKLEDDISRQRTSRRSNCSRGIIETDVSKQTHISKETFQGRP